MRIGLASFESRNGDIPFNLAQIEKGLREASGKAGLLCFGEAFLQGFDSLCWDYEADKSIAVTMDSEIMGSVCALSEKYDVDLVLGYIERNGDRLYSSCAVIIGGELRHNYRRISRGWKEYTMTDEHYAEGDSPVGFEYRGKKLMLSLCGDMWDCPERFKTDGILIWPVFVNYEPWQWADGIEAEYAEQAALAADIALAVNSISHETEPESVGGAFFFRSGKIEAKAEYGKESILFVEV